MERRPGSNSVSCTCPVSVPSVSRTPHDAGGVRASATCRTTKPRGSSITDLVFVDPIGTGFSRPTRAEYGAEFYNTLGDIASIAEFVRVYLTRFDAWDAPLFLAARAMARGGPRVSPRRWSGGHRVAGVMLISGGIQVGPGHRRRNADRALHSNTGRGGVAPRQLARRSAERSAGDAAPDRGLGANRIRPGLEAGGSLTEPNATPSWQLARFTGLDPAHRQADLIVGRQQFAEELLRDQKRVLGRFDTRHVEVRRRVSRRASP